ncbi:hypothetical protein U1Q18_007231 [Sarracenia purpurea var. burkii]
MEASISNHEPAVAVVNDAGIVGGDGRRLVVEGMEQSFCERRVVMDGTGKVGHGRRRRRGRWRFSDGAKDGSLVRRWVDEGGEGRRWVRGWGVKAWTRFSLAQARRENSGSLLLERKMRNPLFGSNRSILDLGGGDGRR